MSHCTDCYNRDNEWRRCFGTRCLAHRLYNAGLTLTAWLMGLLCLIAVSACDKVVKSETLPSYVVQKEVSCTTPGICFGCGTDGECGLGFRLSCPGHQPAIVTVYPKRITYESGRVADFQAEEVQRRTGSCQQ